MDYDDFVITDEQAEKIAINVFNDILLFVKEHKENTKERRKNNRDKVRQAQQRYWEKVAREKQRKSQM